MYMANWKCIIEQLSMKIIENKQQQHFKFGASMQPVVLLLLGIHLAFAGTHSLQYLYTLVSGDINIPEFTVVGLLDEEQFMNFDRKTMKVVPKTDWNNADQWDRQTQIVLGHYQEYNYNMQMIKDVFDHSMSKGVHTLQVMYGCVLEDDGTTRGYYQFGYDGEDFISFDKNNLTNIAANPQAVIFKKKLDLNRAKAQYCKAYLENTCIERLKKYVSYNKDTLEKKAPSQVSLLQKNSSSSVICHATGFYPRHITMTWMKNHEELHEDVEVSSTLPNADGSFQKSISLSVNPEEWMNNPDVYRCVVQHMETEKEIIVSLIRSTIRTNKRNDDDIIAVVGWVALCGVLIIITGLILWKKSWQFISILNRLCKGQE
ncbi:major histocompatibility complex class I-related gene protein-like [Paramisgurnus dabryanus]|uniref:major histocompatibility complex class I-related gene protein-like n=1 Tax=Paramisgurnus dabryanus TaxID=90735 RepID=UPI0031F45119